MRLTMRFTASFCLFFAASFFQSFHSLPAAEERPAAPATQTSPTQNQAQTKEQAKQPLDPFTGRISRKKVRLRLHPTLDAPVIKEMDRGDLVIVTAETEDFYAIAPPQDVKGFIYRTLVLDGVVEGNKVNVRLEPHLESPVIAQLANGDKVEGKVSAASSKWLEISPPPSARFYISKDYVEKVGDADMMAKLQNRKNEVNRLLKEAYQQTRNQLNAPFDQIDLQRIAAPLQAIIDHYNDFPEQAARAKEILTAAQDEYLKKRILFLEEQNEQKSKLLKERQDKMKDSYAAAPQASKEPVKPLAQPSKETSASLSPQMASWLPIEENYHLRWQEKQGMQLPQEQRYALEKQEASLLRGRLEPYHRDVKNKPGDYILFNQNNAPIAYLYSTKVDLQRLAGQQVALLASERPNNRFAFPAFFVLEVAQ